MIESSFFLNRTQFCKFDVPIGSIGKMGFILLIEPVGTTLEYAIVDLKPPNLELCITVHIIYIRAVNSKLLLCSGTFIFFLAGLGQKSSLHVALPKRLIN